MHWIVLVTVLVTVGYLLDREIYFYEGAHLGALLKKYNVDNFQIDAWWKFDRVIAVKNGTATPRKRNCEEAISGDAVCGQTQWKPEARALKCQKCGKELPITQAGIVLN